MHTSSGLRFGCSLLGLALLNGACGDAESSWTHELYADDIHYLSVPAFDELPKGEEMWVGRNHLFGGRPAVRVVSEHGFWTRVQKKGGPMVYVPSMAVRQIAK